MNRKRIRAIFIQAAVICVALAFFTLALSLSFTPEKAIRHIEKNFHFGPATLVHMEKTSDSRIYLGRSGNYGALYDVIRSWGLFWRSSPPMVLENDPTQPISQLYTMRSPEPANFFGKRPGTHENDPQISLITLFGFVNDPQIVKLELTSHLGDTQVLSEFHDGMFLFRYEEPLDYRDPGDGYFHRFEALRGYDTAGKLIYEDTQS